MIFTVEPIAGMLQRMKSSWSISIALVLVLIGAGMAVRFLWGMGNNVGYSPVQPLPFSHKLHAGDNKIPCMYCHSAADKSRHSTVPSMNTCMNCHSVVKTDSPLIKQVQKHYHDGKAFEWIKVHDIPDFVYFNHSRHIKKGIDCQACHGDVASMERVEQVHTMDMGFCINCHKQEQYKAPLDCDTCHR